MLVVVDSGRQRGALPQRSWRATSGARRRMTGWAVRKEGQRRARSIDVLRTLVGVRTDVQAPVTSLHALGPGRSQRYMYYTPSPAPTPLFPINIIPIAIAPTLLKKIKMHSMVILV